MEKIKKAGTFLQAHLAELGIGIGILFLCFMALIYYKFGIGPALSLSELNIVKGFYIVLAGAGIFYLIVVWLVFFVKKLSVPIEKVALCSVAFWGLIFMFLLPPGSAPDEDKAYISSYALSNVMLGKQDANEAGYVYVRAEDAEWMMHRRPGQNDYLTMLTHLFDRCENREMVLCSMQKQDTIFIAFLPQAVGITIGRILGLGQIGLMFLGRLTNYTTFLIFFYLAMKRMPFGKHILFIIAMFPMTLEQMSSMSYDAITISMAFYFIAIVLDLAFRKEQAATKDIILMIVVMAVQAPLKVIYAMLSFLCLLIPMKKFGTKKRYYVAVGCMIAAVCGMILLAQSERFSQYIQGTNNTIQESSSEDKVIPFDDAEQNGSLQTEERELYTFSIVLHNLPRMVAVWGNTIRVLASTYVEQMFGMYLGWLEISVPSIVIYGYFGLFLFACVRRENEAYLPTKKQRGLYLLLFAVIAMLAYLFMLVGHTTNGSEWCMGVQGRYILPALPLLPLALWNDKLNFKNISDSIYTKLSCLVMGGLLTWTVFSVFDLIVRRIGANIAL